MAETLSSSVPSKLRELLAAIERSACVNDDVEELMRLLRRIKATIYDAEEREERDESVKLWLTELEDVADDAEDVLVEYQDLRAQVEGRAAAEACRKRKFVGEGEEACGSTSSSLLFKVSIPDGMADRIWEIKRRFDEISRDRDALLLTGEDGELRATYPPPTSHLVDESAVYGREHDKKEVINLLLSENKENTLSVIPIVGTGGIGKTTLAQLVYNDPSVMQHFNLRGWVCVLEHFDVARLTRAIIESITKKPSSFTELSSLQQTLREELNGKSVLLVLDNVWNDQRWYWESFLVPFLRSGAVSIIVTTRNLSVAEIMQTVCPHRLDYLPEDQCWLLFQHYAFCGRDPPNECSNLIEIGRQIVKRCYGLPLAVKNLARLLAFETREERWMEVLRFDSWKMGEILESLRSSYNQMPFYLKRCFLYLSMYPRDHHYDMDDVVWLWIANGYIQPRGNVGMEDVGKKNFEALLKWTILEAQPSSTGKYVYRMHNMFHVLAQSISRRYASINVDGELTSRRVKHLYVGVTDYKERANFLRHKHELFRTLLAPEGSFKMYGLSMIQWPSLRALCIKWEELDGLPDSIGYLIHLHYLRIHSTTLERLPDSVCRLYNLQILRLETFKLKELPREVGNLVNLYCMYLNVEFKRLPESICSLKNLHKLIYRST